MSALVATGEYGFVSAVPPLVAKNQPTNVEPASVGAAGKVSVPPVTNEPGLTALPPRTS